MGLFTSRKLYYCNMIHTLNMQIDNIAMEKQNLLTLSASIVDGKITAEEFANDPMNYKNYLGFMEGSEAFKQSEQGAGEAVNSIGGVLNGKEYTEEDVAAISQLLNESLGREYAKEQSKKLAAAEHQLDMEQKKLETKLTSAQKHLEQVEQAEARAIQSSIPKYSGLG